MAVNVTETLSVYNSMIAEMKVTLDAEFDANRLQSDLYAKALVSIMQQTMQLATSTVQQQNTIAAQYAEILAATVRNDAQSDKDLLIKASQISLNDSQVSITQQKIVGRKQIIPTVGV